jgi:hypothetical protein
MEVQEISELDLAFPARGVELMPDLDSVPAEFRDRSNPWHRFADEWFMHGWPDRGLFPLVEVSPEKAVRHVSVVLGCHGIKHEDKITGVAYMLSLWFRDIGPQPKTEDASKEAEPR